MPIRLIRGGVRAVALIARTVLDRFLMSRQGRALADRGTSRRVTCRELHHSSAGPRCTG